MNTAKRIPFLSIALALCVGAGGCVGGMVAGPGEADAAHPDSPVAVPADASDAALAPPGDADDDASCEDGGPCEGLNLEPDDAGPSDAGPVRGDAGVVDAIGGDPGPSDSGAASPEDGGPALPDPTCASVDQRLLQDFGIVITPATIPWNGFASENIDCEDRIKVYQMYALPFHYPGYVRRLDPSRPFTIHLYRSVTPGPYTVMAYVPNARTVKIRDLAYALSHVSGPTDRNFMHVAMLLIHESGHIISARNPSMRPAFGDANLAARDPQCYVNGLLRTYTGPGTNLLGESMAEATGLFIVHSRRSIADFRTDCPNTYEWIRANLYEYSL